MKYKDKDKNKDKNKYKKERISNTQLNFIFCCCFSLFATKLAWEIKSKVGDIIIDEKSNGDNENKSDMKNDYTDNNQYFELILNILNSLISIPIYYIIEYTINKNFQIDCCAKRNNTVNYFLHFIHLTNRFLLVIFWNLNFLNSRFHGLVILFPEMFTFIKNSLILPKLVVGLSFFSIIFILITFFGREYFLNIKVHDKTEKHNKVVEKNDSDISNDITISKANEDKKVNHDCFQEEKNSDTKSNMEINSHKNVNNKKDENHSSSNSCANQTNNNPYIRKDDEKLEIKRNNFYLLFFVCCNVHTLYGLSLGQRSDHVLLIILIFYISLFYCICNLHNMSNCDTNIDDICTKKGKLSSSNEKENKSLKMKNADDNENKTDTKNNNNINNYVPDLGARENNNNDNDSDCNDDRSSKFDEIILLAAFSIHIAMLAKFLFFATGHNFDFGSLQVNLMRFPFFSCY